MCDKYTTPGMDAALARRGLTRREFAALGSAAAIAACSPTDGAEGTGEPANAELSESSVTIATPDGTADGFFVHPGKGVHPGVLMWPDIAGLRQAYEVMARRLAAEGYAVLAVNQYYRNARAPILESLSEWFDEAKQAKLQPMIAALDGGAIARDSAAFTAWLDAQGAVDKDRKIGSCGYCFGGQMTVRTAAAMPERIGAACSFHGAMLVTDAPDSPHRLMKDSKASFLIAIGQNDDAQHPGEKDVLHQAAEEAGRPAEIEVYPADHGWCTIDAPSYDKEQAEKAWGRMLATYEASL